MLPRSRPRTVVATTLACLVATLAGGAAAAPAAEKALWGPAATLPDGSPAFALYDELGIDTLQLTVSWSDVAPAQPAAPADPADPAYRLAGRRRPRRRRGRPPRHPPEPARDEHPAVGQRRARPDLATDARPGLRRLPHRGRAPLPRGQALDDLGRAQPRRPLSAQRAQQRTRPARLCGHPRRVLRGAQACQPREHRHRRQHLDERHRQAGRLPALDAPAQPPAAAAGLAGPQPVSVPLPGHHGQAARRRLSRHQRHRHDQPRRAADLRPARAAVAVGVHDPVRSRLARLRDVRLARRAGPLPDGGLPPRRRARSRRRGHRLAGPARRPAGVRQRELRPHDLRAAQKARVRGDVPRAEPAPAAECQHDRDGPPGAPAHAHRPRRHADAEVDRAGRRRAAPRPRRACPHARRGPRRPAASPPGCAAAPTPAPTSCTCARRAPRPCGAPCACGRPDAPVHV